MLLREILVITLLMAIAVPAEDAACWQTGLDSGESNLCAARHDHDVQICLLGVAMYEQKVVECWSEEVYFCILDLYLCIMVNSHDIQSDGVPLYIS